MTGSSSMGFVCQFTCRRRVFLPVWAEATTKDRLNLISPTRSVCKQLFTKHKKGLFHAIHRDDKHRLCIRGYPPLSPIITLEVTTRYPRQLGGIRVGRIKVAID